MIQGRKAFTSIVMGLLIVGTANGAENKQVDYILGEYVVTLKENYVKSKGMNDILGGFVREAVTRDGRVLLLERSLIETSEFALASLQNNEAVERVEPNWIYRAINRPDDPKLEELWGLINSGQKRGGVEGRAGVDVGAEAAWDISTGSKDVVVAVIDTGVDYTHQDIAPNIWINEQEMNGEVGVDDDDNGFIDDIHGFDFSNDDADPMDDHSHGTHCSGTIGAKGNDGIGIVGVAWNVSIMAVKFLSSSGSGSLAGAIKSIDYATLMKVDIMSNSWGGGGFSETLKESIERANEAGILFIAAAGNDSGNNNDTNPAYPASYKVDNVISVAAVDHRGQLASFSNVGAESVHLAAPGVDVLSSTPGDAYSSFSGTSMATPHVAGVAALLKSAEPELTHLELKARLLKTAKPLGALRGLTATGGVANAYYALMDEEAPLDEQDPFNWESQEYSVSSEHPYEDGKTYTFRIEVPNATQLAIHFERFETESYWDKVTFADEQGREVSSWSGTKSNIFSPVVQGSVMILTFKTDSSNTNYGFDIDRVAFK